MSRGALGLLARGRVGALVATVQAINGKGGSGPRKLGIHFNYLRILHYGGSEEVSRPRGEGGGEVRPQDRHQLRGHEAVEEATVGPAPVPRPPGDNDKVRASFEATRRRIRS